MPQHNYKNSLKRGLGYLLILLIEIIAVAQYGTEGHLFSLIIDCDKGILITITVAILLLWLGLSWLYSLLKAGGWRVNIAGILAVFWPLLIIPFWLCESTSLETMSTGFITLNLLLPSAFLLLPALFFELTEPHTKKNLWKQTGIFVIRTLTVAGCITAFIYIVFDTPGPLTQDEIHHALRFQVDCVQMDKKVTRVQARIINLTHEHIILESPEAIVNGHPNRDKLTRCLCCKKYSLPDIIRIPANGELPVTLTFKNAKITNGLYLTFRQATFNGKRYAPSDDLFVGYNIRAEMLQP